MIEKYQYPSLHDRSINNAVRSFCRTEGIDEAYFTFCACKRVRGVARENGILSKIVTELSWINNAGKWRYSKRMLIIIFVVIVILIGIAVFVSRPIPDVRTEFISADQSAAVQTVCGAGVFGDHDILRLPTPVRRYFRYCGYLGTHKMNTFSIEHKDVRFQFRKDGKPLEIDYIQSSHLYPPARFAYMKCSRYGIPFEGLDSFHNGKGFMRGVLGRVFTLFHQKGVEMDQASLVSFLSECLLEPNAALQDYMTWKKISPLQAQASISFLGREASGIFTFNEAGEVISFSGERDAVLPGGEIEKTKWMATFSNYQVSNGIRRPTVLKAYWCDGKGSFLYFDSKNVRITSDRISL